MTSLSTLETIPEILAATVASHADQPALGSIRNGVLQWRTWQQVFQEAQQRAAAIQNTGVRPGDRVAQISENRPEWVITDLALHLAGAVHVPVHVSLSGPQIAAQITDSGARLVLVSTPELRAKFQSLIDPAIPVWCYEEDEVPQPHAAVDCLASRSATDPQSLATILYTSGTTGRPRGVMLSQRNLASNATALADSFGHSDRQLRLNILPLSHIYARTCDLYTWVYRGCRLVLAESRETLGRDCQLVRPTTLNAVPYVYQKIAGRVQSAGGDLTEQAANLRAYFGGAMEALCCGGAPISPQVEQWFSECGMPILSGYGLTESSPVITASTPARRRFWTVGPPLANVEVRIAPDGEVETRGPHVMLGYWHDDEAIREVIRDGWLSTGDLGHLDADGFLTIRGRKKELIVLSTGKKVDPARVESLLTTSPWIEQAVVLGEGRASLAALLVPAEAATARDLDFGKEVTRCLETAAQEEQVRRFTLLDRPLSHELGEMTPKLSLCRETIAANFHDTIERLYGGEPANGVSGAASVTHTTAI